MSKTTPAPVTKSGVPLTDEVAERLADEAEAGYDLDEGTVVHRGRGRPAFLDPDSSQVTFRLSAKLRAQAEQKASKEGISVSGLAREALKHYIAS